MKFEKNFSIAYIRKRRTVWGLLETSGLTILVLILAILIHPDDPFSLKGPFPWLCLCPLFCTLLYGSLNGVLSLLLMIIALTFYQQHYDLDSIAVRYYIVGLIALTLLTGIFSSFWLARIRHVEHLNRYVREHLEDLSRDYYLVRISHERLEHAYITKPLSFRDAFYQIKMAIQKNHGQLDAEVSQQVLGIFAQYCSINSAALCLYNSKADTLDVISTLGKQFFANVNDPLIRQAIEENATTYLAINTINTHEMSDYLAIVPLLTAQRKILGFIIIKEMPFWSLTHDNLEVLSVFAAALVSRWTSVKKVQELLTLYPTASPEFLQEFQSLIRLKKYHEVDSALTGLIIPEGYAQQNLVYSMEQNKRSLDYTWTVPMPNAKLVITLIPLSSMEGIQGYRKRIGDWLKSEFGHKINHNGLNFRYHQLSKQKASVQLEQFIAQFTEVNGDSSLD